MAWGGARPGAGRPSIAKKKRDPVNVPKVAADRKIEARAKSMRAFTEMDVQRIVETSRKIGRAGRALPPANPFDLPKFPEKATPAGNRMAMDSNLSWAGAQWSGAVLGDMVGEGLSFPGYTYLAELAQRPEYRVISETISTEMTREWIEFETVSGGGAAEGEGEGEDATKARRIKEITDEFERLQVREHFKLLAALDGFFGRSHLFIDLGAEGDELASDIGDGTDEASKTKVQKGSLKALRVIEPVWCYPTTYNAQNPLAPNWYRPDVWYVMGTQIHRSRLPMFVGHPVPDLLKPAYSFGGISMSQMAQPYVDIWLQTRESVAALIRSFSVMILKTDMQTILQPGGAGVGGIIARAMMFNALRDNQGLMVVNKATEEFENVSASLAGLHELQAQSQEHMASVARIPLVKFTGISPSGLNASSDGELRAFYDTIHSCQESFFRPHLTTVLNFVQLSLHGSVDPSIRIKFIPLYALTEKELAEVQKFEAETDQIHVDVGALHPAEVRKRIAHDPDTAYSDIDVDDVPDLKEEEDEGLVPGGKKPEGGEGGGQDSQIVPFLAGDEFEEGKHPRDDGGKFASGSGGGGGSAAAPAAAKKKSAFGGLYKSGATPKEAHENTVKHVLSKPPNAGSSYRQMLAKLVKDAPGFGTGAHVGALKAHLAKAMLNAQEAALKLAANAPDGEKSKMFQNIAAKAGAKAAAIAPAAAVPLKTIQGKEGMEVNIYKNSDGKQLNVVLKDADSGMTIGTKFVPTMEHAEKVAKEFLGEKAAPQASPAEIEVAKKSTTLPISSTEPGAFQAIKDFNEKYAGKNITDPAALNQKVADYKEMKAKVDAGANKQKADEKAAVLKALNDPATKADYEVLHSLGTTAYINDAKHKIKAAGLEGKITPHQAAHIIAYSGSHFAPVNRQLRDGVVDEEQWGYTKALNAALSKLPKKAGKTMRGTTLPAGELAKYQVGKVVEERAFLSTGVGKKFSGATTFEIHGKTGRDISKLSSHPGENEVLFPSASRFKVTSRTGNHIVMEEVDYLHG